MKLWVSTGSNGVFMYTEKGVAGPTEFIGKHRGPTQREQRTIALLDMVEGFDLHEVGSKSSIGRWYYISAEFEKEQQ